MSRFWSEITKKVEPYVPGEQPRDRKYIKLNTNESPYPPSPKALDAIKMAAGEGLRLYPDPTCSDLRAACAEYYGLDKSQVFIGNGSDELLAFCFMAFFNPGKPILFADITYSFYPVYAELFNIDYTLVALDDDFDMPVDRFLAPNGGVIICNPNAPTGKLLPFESIERILDGNPDSVVMVDEAYIDFGGDSAVGLIDKHDNLLVIHTMSKSRSLAGMRLGMAMGHKELIEGLDRVKNSFNSYTIDRLALAGGVEAMKDVEYFNFTRQKVIDTRERVAAELRAMGFNVVDSKTNFIFISHPEVMAQAIFQKLREKGILVRYFKKPRIDNYLRVTIGTDEEMDSFIQAVRQILGK